jgi:hypothetical protein
MTNEYNQLDEKIKQTNFIDDCEMYMEVMVKYIMIGKEFREIYDDGHLVKYEKNREELNFRFGRTDTNFRVTIDTKYNKGVISVCLTDYISKDKKTTKVSFIRN